MKRNILYLVLCVNLLVGMTSCYEDKSTEATIEIPEIVIDTTGIGGNIVLRKYDRLQLAPKVSKEGTDASKFSYKWMLSMKPVKFGTQDAYECISEEKDLDAEIDRDDDETTYRLWYQVTDNTTGLRKDMIWTIRVLSIYGEGLLVAEEVDGGTDLALIESEEFSEGYEDQPLIRHGIYSKANENAKIDSDLLQLTAWREGNNQFTKYYLLLGKNGNDKYLLLDKNYKLKYRNEEGFTDFAVSNVNPTQFVTFAYAVYLINDNSLHWLYTSPNSSQMKWSPAVPYSDKSYVKLNKLAGGMYTGYNYSFYYDEEDNCFKTVYNTLMRWDLISITKGAADRVLGIDPGNCSNIEMLFGGPGPDKKVYGLLRNTETGNYSILGLNSSSNKFNAYYEIPTCELDNAIDYACYEMGNVFYFATSHKVYAIQLNAEPVNVTEIYSSADEITHMSIFRQAKNATYYSNATLEGSAQTILVATWNGSKGTVHAIPIKNHDTGELDTEKANKYEGFGKISKVIHQYP